MIAPVVTLPANTYGYTCWDNTANRELFTMTFTDITNPTRHGPDGDEPARSLPDRRLRFPIAALAGCPLAQITGMTRLYVTVDWASMVDSPFTIAPYLPAQ